MATEAEVDLPKLWGALEKDLNVLEKFCTKRLELVKEAVGDNYAMDSECPTNPINLLSQYERIITGHIVGAEPRGMVSTFKAERRRDATIFESWMNKKLAKMKFGNIARRALQGALYLIGITRTAITAPAEARFGGYGKQAGVPTISTIDFEDFVCDTRARCWEQCEYMGHRYEVLHEDVRKSPLFKKRARLKVVPADDKLYNESGGEKIRTLTRDNEDSHRYQDTVELYEVWLRRENVVVTFDANGDMREPLLVQKWIGPACGPYQFLSFLDVLGNLIPKAPMMDLVHLARSVNLLWCKVDNQASDAKRVIAYQNAEDAEKFKNAPDGGWVQATSPDAIKEVTVRTIDQNTALWAQNSEKFFSKMAGNLDSLGGLGAQADTATQEKMIAENSSSLIHYMSIRFVEFAQECMNSLGWFWWYNPHDTMESEYHVPGMEAYQVTQQLTPSDRLGKNLDDMDIVIDPHSLIHQTPQMKLNIINNVMEKQVIPLLPMFSQPGISEVLDKWIRIQAKLANVPELLEIVEPLLNVQAPPQSDQSGDPAEQGMPPETTRTYERISKPGTTDNGQRQILEQLMAGGQTNQGGGMESMMGRAG